MHNQDSLFELVKSKRAIILDFNGTLSDDEDLFEHFYNTAITEYGKPLESGEYQSLLGKSDYDITRAILERRGLSGQTENVLDRVTEMYATATATRSTIGQHSLKVVQHWIDTGKKVAIATGTLRRMIEPVLRNVGLDMLIPTLTTIEDVKEGKPAPETFLQAAQKLHAEVSEIVVFEDSPVGVTAAKAANMDYIQVGNGPHSHFPSFDAFAERMLVHDGVLTGERSRARESHEPTTHSC